MPDAPQKPGWRYGCGCLCALFYSAIGFVTGYMWGTLTGYGDFAFVRGASLGVIGAGIGLVVGLVALVAFWKSPTEPRQPPPDP